MSGIGMEDPQGSGPQRTPLLTEDARILALETGSIRGHILKVLVLEDTGEPLSVEDLRRQLAQRLSDGGRWRDRLVSDPSAASGFAWEPDPDFDVARHVAAVPDAGALDEAGLRSVIADSMKEPLARDRPLWTVQVVTRLADGRSVLIWKVHHSLADGITVMRAGARLLWTGDEPPPSGGPAAPPEAGAAKQLRAGARLVRVVGYRGLFVREFRRAWGRTPLAGEVGPERAAAWTGCDLATLRAVGGAVRPHATVNDVLLAAVSGSLRGWLRARGRAPRAMKVMVPVSMHSAGGADREGNQDSFLLVRLPLGEPEPVARLTAVARATRRRKNHHDAQAIYELRDSLSHAPTVLQQRVQHLVQGPREYSLSISNVPGPRAPISVLDRHVEELYSFAEVAPHHGLRVSAVSLEGRLYVGLLADPGLVPNLGELAAGIDAELRLLGERLNRPAAIPR